MSTPPSPGNVTGQHPDAVETLAAPIGSPRPIWRQLSIASLLALIFLCVGWELAWAPIRPGGSWLVLKVLPLLAMLPGLLKSRLYSFQWASMAILLYFAEGSVRATSDTNPTSVTLAWIETGLSTVLFCALLMYTRAFKRPKTAEPVPGN